MRYTIINFQVKKSPFKLPQKKHNPARSLADLLGTNGRKESIKVITKGENEQIYSQRDLSCVEQWILLAGYKIVDVNKTQLDI